MMVSVGNHDLTDSGSGTSYNVTDSYDFGFDAFDHDNDLILLKVNSSISF